MDLPDRDQALTWGGRVVLDRSGARIGVCTQVFTDDATGRPEWAAATMGGTTVVVPLVDAVEADGAVRVRVARDQALLAPIVDDLEHLSEDDEARLYRHYGIPYSREDSPSGLPGSPAGAGHDGTAPAAAQQAPPGAAPRAAVTSALAGLRRVLAAGPALAAVTALVALAAVLVARRRRPPRGDRGVRVPRGADRQGPARMRSRMAASGHGAPSAHP